MGRDGPAAGIGGEFVNYRHAIAAARRGVKSYNPITVAILDEWAEFLRGTDCNVTSQNGEDGLLSALFAKIGTRNKWCFEVGASDGREWSNTWPLRGEWTRVLIEADEAKYAEMQKHACAREYLFCKRIKPHDLDFILRAVDAPVHLDLGVIDIDGGDDKVWAGLTKYRPRVVLIEYNVAGDGMLSAPYSNWQAGADTVIALGREKGYRPLVRTGCNLLFVDEKEIT